MRVKRGTVSHRRHKKLLASTSGYRMTKSRLIKVAKEASLHAGQYAFQGRKQRKSNFRRLWISRLSGAVREAGLTYSQFFFKLKKAKIILDRKILSNLAISDSEAFNKIVDKVKNV